ncbi:MAG TPA: hypothetical protein VF209_02765 [Patescibacteria group bacterium]
MIPAKDKNQEQKVKIIGAWFDEMKLRWSNIQKIHELYPGEGLVLALCFTEAMGYSRYGEVSNLSPSEQFVKILQDYQSDGSFIRVDSYLVQRTPLEREKRTLGRSISREVLEWLKIALPEGKSMHLSGVWENLPEKILRNLNVNHRVKAGYLFQLTWAGYYYSFIRSAGVHRGVFDDHDEERRWQDIVRANNEIYSRLREECVEEIVFPFELDQPKTLLEVTY